MGVAGAGKTKLVSTVVDDQLGSFAKNSKREALAYFYCDRNRAEFRNLTSILSSFVRQLSISQDEKSVHNSSVQLYDDRRRSGFASNQLSFEEAQTQLYKLTQKYPQTILVLDALDECEECSRTEIVRSLNRLISQPSGLIKIFISSRPDPDLRIELEHGPNLEIKAEDNHDDIIKYVDSTITSPSSPYFWRFQISKELRQRVYDRLVVNSEGM